MWAVKIQIEGFRPIYTEVLFIDMKPENGIYDLVDKVPEKQISIQYEPIKTQVILYMV